MFHSLGNLLAFIALSFTFTSLSGCEYEWKEDARSAEPYLAQQGAASAQGAEQSEKPKQVAPPPDLKPVLAPGKDVSGQAVLPPKARK